VRKQSILVCDDLGNEWADYIEFNKSGKSISLLHCKHGKESTSAAQLHEVVAQALKNIGRVSPTSSEIENKVSTWSKKYGKTKISRIRSNHTEKQIQEITSELIESPDCVKEIALVVPFLKKSELDDGFGKVSRSEEVKPHLPQLIWLLSSFVSTCKDAGIKPIIYAAS